MSQTTTCGCIFSQAFDGNFSTSLVLLCEERPAYLCPTNALVAYALLYLIHQYIIATYM